MKKIICAVLCLACFSTVMADSRFVDVSGENPAAPDLSSYTTILVSRLDIPAGLWQDFGYQTKEEWLTVVDDINNQKLKLYMTERAPGKTIVAPVEGFSGQDAAFVKLAYRGFRKHTGRAFGHKVDTLDVTVTIYDNKSKKQLYTANLGAQSAGMFKRGWMMNAFEGRIDNQIFNLCCFIAGKF
jgi:hypothetical protein